MPIFTLAQTRNGPMLACKHDTYIGAALHKYGEFSHLEALFFAEIVKPGMTVVEVGANIGAHTISLARMVGETGSVFAIEPQRIIFQALCGNVALADLTNVFALNVAAGKEQAVHCVLPADYRQPNNFGGMPVEPESDDSMPGSEPVLGVTLDDAPFPTGTKIFLKIDAEGAEADILRGAVNLITKSRPIMYVENDRAEKSADLVALIVGLGYTCWWHTPPLFNPDNFNGAHENDFLNSSGRSLLSFNMVCLPVESEPFTQPFIDKWDLAPLTQ